jgi:dephospho-CoA kinase
MVSFKEFISEGIEDKGILKAVFLAGSPGAGKSYTIGKISDGSIEPRIVNTDKFFEFLSNKIKVKLDTLSGAENAWSFASDKTKYLTTASLSQYLNSMLPLVIDGTSSNSNNLLMRVGILESLGYDVAMVYVKTDLETAIKRVQARDRKVPEEFITKVFNEMIESEEFYRGKFTHFVEINNNDGELTNDAIIAAFKKMRSFYSAPVKNPVGKRIVEQLRDGKQKYLVPSIIEKSELQKKLDMWYRK